MPQQPTFPSRILALLSCTALAVAPACAPEDPLEEIRIAQDQRGDHAGAIEPLRELMQSRPDDPEVRLRYGLALIGTGNASQAMWSLKQAMRSPEWLETAGLALAGVFASLGNHDDAIEAYGQVLEAHPDSREARLGRGLARIKSRRYYEEGLEDADRALELDPDDEQALVLRGLALLGLERADEAAVVIEQLESGHREDALGLHGSPGFCAVRGSFAHELGKLDEAEEHYEHCLSLFPAAPLVVEHAAKFFDAQGRRDRSEEILARALEETPGDHGLRDDLIRRLRGRGADDAAEALLRAATQLEGPGDAAVGWSKLALWELENGKVGAAVAAFDQARQLAPAYSAELAFAHSDALVLAGQYDRALRIAEETGVPAYQMLVRGRVALLQRDPQAAFRHFTEGVRLWPDNPVARYYLAVAAEQVDDFSAAIEHYRAAMRADSRATDAYLRLARLHVASGDLDQARTILAFQPGGRPRELEAGLLQLEVLARLRAGPSPYLEQYFSHPDRRARGVAALAAGIRQQSGAEAAVDFLRRQELVDLSDPLQAPALEALVESLAAADRADEGLVAVDAALGSHPDEAAIHALRARALELQGAPAAHVLAAYERALELDPAQPAALSGLGARSAERGEHAAALDYYERALAAAPEDRGTARGAARALVALDRAGEAEERLEALLRDRPDDAAVALALATLRIERGAVDERTLGLAQRAVRFQGGPEAQALIERLGAETGEEGSADDA